MKVAIIGSGPAATGAAMGLVARGLKPELLDIGERLDARRAKVVSSLAQTPRAEWPEASLRQIVENPTAAGGEIPRKLAFGSDYIYARERAYGRTKTNDVDYLPTHAAGGYSSVWGAAMLPIHQDDMEGWPITRGDLEPHYQRVGAALPLCGEIDALADDFPTWREMGTLPYGTPTTVLLARLKQRGLDYGPNHRVGRSRLAVHDRGSHACVGCGLCLSGCPVGAIYSTLDTIETLQRDGKVEHRDGQAILALQPRDGKVDVEALDIDEGRIKRMQYDYVFLAAGAINSSRILLNSRSLFDVEAVLRDSQKMVLPAVLLARLGRLDREDAISLAGLFMELKLPEHSRHWFHAQISSVNDLLLSHFGIDPFAPTPLPQRPLRLLLNHTLILWCGLNSELSSTVALSIAPDATHAMPTVRLAAQVNPAVPETANHLRRAIARVLRQAGAQVIGPARKLGLPGSGGHVGGSFPMRARPSSELDTDALGRPFGWSRVFLVDGACLPTIPGTTLAYTIMANAHRIASTADLDEIA